MTTTHRTPVRPTLLRSLQACVVLAVLPGCQLTLLKPTSEDSVRERVAEVERINEALRLENAGLRARIAESELVTDRDEEAILAAMPRLSAVSIGSSSVVEAGPDGSPRLTLRLGPSDDRGRFMQIVGDLSVRVVAVPVDGSPLPLAVARFDPIEVRDAWRGGVFGTGYVFEIPLQGAGTDELPETVDVVVNFTDATNGLDIRDEQPVRVAVPEV